MFRLLVIIFIFQPSKVESTPSIAIDVDRAQLLKDTLGWMTFRENGVLMEDSEVGSLFLDTIMRKYATSKMYRAFVIAFQQGVLPRLTLNESDTCDPAYTLEYKDPFNNSVTWYYQKKFTFNYYDKINSSDVQFCDYRQGLVCKTSTKTCGCPEGSSMQPISEDSLVQRCLLKENETCALIDIDHGRDPKHSSLGSNLYHMIFNLEKPLSCKTGTQCRFKKENWVISRCYEVNNGSWYPGPQDLDLAPPRELGEGCVLGLYADVGTCKVSEPFDGLGVGPGLVCYNFGPPRSTPGVANKIGYCYSEWGIFDLSYTGGLSIPTYYRPFIIAFVHPRTVPLRGEELADYYKKYISKVSKVFQQVESEKEGDMCSVSKTKMMEDAWKYFSSFEDEPSTGQDYVSHATTAGLEAMLQKVIDLLDNVAQKVCKVYWSFYQTDPEEEFPALTCVANDSTDAHGNDGTCQISGDNDTEPFARRLKTFIDTTLEIQRDERNEDNSYIAEILLKNPEPPCLPSLGSELEALEEEDEEEEGICPDGSVCYEDYSDSHQQYDSDCNPSQGVMQLLICHAVSKPLGKCENQYLERRVKQAISELEAYETKGEGEPCYFKFERTLRLYDGEIVGNWNKYQLLQWLERGILCDRARQKLECSMAGTCECIGGHCDNESITFSARELKENGVNHVTSSSFIIFIKCLLSLTCPFIVPL